MFAGRTETDHSHKIGQGIVRIVKIRQFCRTQSSISFVLVCFLFA